MSISEQVKELREIVRKVYGGQFVTRLKMVEELSKASNTIEALSAKQENAYYVKRNGKDDVIVSIMYNKADNKYHFVNLSKNHICACGFETTEEAIADMEQRKNNGSICDFYLMERSAEDCGGGWIYCGDGENLPKEPFACIVTVIDTEPMTMTDFEAILPYQVGYSGGTWNDSDGWQIPFDVIAWMKAPTEPYHEP